MALFSGCSQILWEINQSRARSKRSWIFLTQKQAAKPDGSRVGLSLFHGSHRLLRARLCFCKSSTHKDLRPLQKVRHCPVHCRFTKDVGKCRGMQSHANSCKSALCFQAILSPCWTDMSLVCDQNDYSHCNSDTRKKRTAASNTVAWRFGRWDDDGGELVRRRGVERRRYNVEVFSAWRFLRKKEYWRKKYVRFLIDHQAKALNTSFLERLRIIARI